MLNPIDSQSGAQEIGGGDFPVMSLDQAAPAQIVAQVAGSHAVEAARPLLEPAIAGIDVLDMIDTRDDTLTGGPIDRAVGDPHFFGSRRQRLCATGAQNDIGHQKRLGDRPDVRLAGFAAPLAGCPAQALSSTFLRFKEAGFTGFGNSSQADRLPAVGQLQKAVAPAECRAGMNADSGGAFAYALPFNRLLRTVNPLRSVPKSRRGRPGQSIEGRPAGAAAIPPQTVDESPAGNPFVRAMRADRLLGHPGFDQLVGRRCLRRRLQQTRQDLPLVWGVGSFSAPGSFRKSSSFITTPIRLIRIILL